MNWQEWFPFENVREDQKVALDFIADAWKTKDTVVLQLPTGVGKSGIAKTASKIAGALVSADQLRQQTMMWSGQKNTPLETPDYKNFDQLEKTWLITPQKILQAQYLKDFSDIANIQNKGDYHCSAYEDRKSCADGYALRKVLGEYSLDDPELVTTLGAKGELAQMIESLRRRGFGELPCGTNSCAYRKAFIDWQVAPISLTNTSYFLACSKTKQIAPRKCLIVDEAHQIEEDLVNFYSITISPTHIFERYGIKVKSFDVFSDFRQWIEEILLPAIGNKIDHVKAQIILESGLKNCNPERLSALTRDHEEATRFFDKCAMISDYEDEEWVLKRTDDGEEDGTMLAQPLHSSIIGSDYLLAFGVKKLFMSGTILDKNLFCETVGLNPGDVAYFERDSPFDAEKRIVFVDPCGSMSRKNIDTTIPIMLDRIEEIMEDHRGEKGIIHTGSYKIAEIVKRTIKSPRLLFHANAKERDIILEEHFLSRESTILVSPSMLTGVDLKGDLATFGIMMKIPWPYLGDKRIAKLKEESSDWYAWRAIQQLLQGCGRINRDYADDALMYILDSDMINVIRYNGRFLPDWWIDGLRFSEEAATALGI